MPFSPSDKCAEFMLSALVWDPLKVRINETHINLMLALLRMAFRCCSSTYGGICQAKDYVGGALALIRFVFHSQRLSAEQALALEFFRHPPRYICTGNKCFTRPVHMTRRSLARTQPFCTTCPHKIIIFLHLLVRRTTKRAASDSPRGSVDRPTRVRTSLPLSSLSVPWHPHPWAHKGA